MAIPTVTERNEGKNLQSREETRSSEKFIRPVVDIIESEDGLRVVADIPGAAKNTLEASVEQGILTITAPVSWLTPGQPVYSEFELAHYYRQFSLPEGLDHEKTAAEFIDGVLTVRIPKTEAAKPHKIEILAA
jgi:HSP20 family protein